jgi:hypothetical protein
MGLKETTEQERAAIYELGVELLGIIARKAPTDPNIAIDTVINVLSYLVGVAYADPNAAVASVADALVKLVAVNQAAKINTGTEH